MQCQYIEQDGTLLIVWLFSTTDEFEDAVQLYEDLVATIELPENGGNDDPGNQDNEDVGSGIENNSYTSPTYGFSIEWDDNVWTANPDAELINNGEVGQDRLNIEHIEDGELYSGFYIEAKTDYEGDVTECISAEADLFFDDTALLDLEPYVDDLGDPIAGESNADGEFATFFGTYEDDAGETYELIWYLECQTLEEGESVATFSLFAGEADYEDELVLATPRHSIHGT